MGQPFDKEDQLGMALLTREDVEKLVLKTQAQTVMKRSILADDEAAVLVDGKVTRIVTATRWATFLKFYFAFTYFFILNRNNDW